MRKIFYILLFFIIATSCGNQEGNDFVGKWVEKQKEGDLSEIIKNGKTYIVIDDEGKYPAEYKDGMLEISSPVGAIKATIDKQTNTLIIGGKEFIRYENASKPKFIGEWVVSFSNRKDIDLSNVVLKIEMNDRNNFVIFGDTGRRIYDFRFENGEIKIYFSADQFYKFTPTSDNKLEAININNSDDYFVLSRKDSSNN